jgi:molybdopterin converting factor small subunit
MSPTKENKGSGVVTIRLFGFLRALRKERGLPVCFDRAVPREGKSGSEIAAELELPEARIEAVFRNGLIQDLDQKVFPGDRIAFVPPGTPGPYRVLLGMVGGKKGPEP